MEKQLYLLAMLFFSFMFLTKNYLVNSIKEVLISF